MRRAGRGAPAATSRNWEDVYRTFPARDQLKKRSPQAIAAAGFRGAGSAIFDAVSDGARTVAGRLQPFHLRQPEIVVRAAQLAPGTARPRSAIACRGSRPRV